jgi:hypothetical protein
VPVSVSVGTRSCQCPLRNSTKLLDKIPQAAVNSIWPKAFLTDTDTGTDTLLNRLQVFSQFQLVELVA